LEAFSQSQKYSVVKNTVRLFDSWFVDIRDFQFFIRKYL